MNANLGDEILHKFAVLHQGRNDVWGTVWGECKRERLTPEHWRQHLWQRGSLGIYCLVEGRVRWGCVDIDNGVDMLVLARNVRAVLGQLGIAAWVERSKGKGYHVWTYATDWVPAADMRAALLVACQVAGYAAKEVNPKQVDIGHLEHGLGNYVNLPYCKEHADQGKRVVLDMDASTLDGIPPAMRLDQFVELAWASRTMPAVYAQAAALYVPPPPPPKIAVPDYDPDQGVDKAIVTKLTGLAWTIFNEGPAFGRDRSGTLQRLAHLMAETPALSAAEAYLCLVDADLRWGKYSERPDGERELQGMINRAWGRAKRTS